MQWQVGYQILWSDVGILGHGSARCQRSLFQRRLIQRLLTVNGRLLSYGKWESRELLAKLRNPPLTGVLVESDGRYSGVLWAVALGAAWDWRRLRDALLHTVCTKSRGVLTAASEWSRDLMPAGWQPERHGSIVTHEVRATTSS